MTYHILYWSGRQRNRVSCIYLLSLLVLLLTGNSMRAGNPDSTYFSNTAYIVPTLFLETQDGISTPEDVLTIKFDTAAKTMSYGKALALGKTYWLKLDLYGLDLRKSNLWVVYMGYLDNVELYTQEGESFETTQGGLIWTDAKRENSPIGPLGPGEFLIDTAHLIQGRYLIARLAPEIWYFSTYVPEIYHPTLAMVSRSYFSRAQLKRTIPHLVFLGSVLMMALFTLAVYVMTREKKVFFYLMYLTSLLLYLGVRSEPWVSWFHEQAFFTFYVYNELIQVFVNMCYLLFVAAFLQTKANYPVLHKMIQVTIGILVLVILMQSILLANWNTVRYERLVIDFERYLMIVFTLVTYWYLWKHGKGTAVWIIVIGSICFLTGAIFAMIFKDIQYLVVGAFLEIIVFSAGMGLDIRNTNRLKEQLRSEVDRVRLIALKAQMNPHFISNSLNSVRAYIIRNEQNKASEYLNNFAHLVRLILHYSSLDLITVSEELHAINLYVKLEALRHRMDFGYSAVVSEEINADSAYIPPLILQPFVENAIVHGLTPSTRDKQLELRLSKSTDNVMEAIITDNGIGRSVNQAKTVQPKPHKSVAIGLTRRRIQLLKNDANHNFGVFIDDLKENGDPSGTQVTIRLPFLTTQNLHTNPTA